MKPWLQAYPKGIAHEIDVNAYPSLAALIDESLRRYRQLSAYTNMGCTLSFGDLDRLSTQFGVYLQQAGLNKGDRVAVMLPNLLQYPVAIFGALRAGFTVVNVNPLYTARELRHQLNDSGARAILILENFAHILAEVIADTQVEHVVVTRVGDMLPPLKGALVNLAVKHIKKMVPSWRIDGSRSFKQALAAAGDAALRPVELRHDDLAFLQYTGGTTGISKGACLSHRNMIANMLQIEAWVRDRLQPGKEVAITALPLYHIFSLTANCLVFLKLGGHNILITNPRDMPAFIKELGKHRFTYITGVNTLFNGLLNQPDFAKLDFKPMKLSIGGGTAVQQAVAERWQKVTGIPLIEGYGLTETSPVACCNSIEVDTYSGGIGYPLPSTEVEIRDEQGRTLPAGEIGELCVKGPQVMSGYWNRPEESEQVLNDGWLRTGDMAVMDEHGFCRIVDRKKDMILVSGFNVYPNEIEEVLAQHPDVVEAAAIGVEDEKSGEAVKAFVVPRDRSLSADELRAHCKKNLTGYKVPKYFEFRDELPKTNVGKILRRELR